MERRPGAIPLGAVLALSDEGFAYVGSDAHILAWSEGAESLTEIAAERAIGADVRTLLQNAEALIQVPFDGVRHDLRLGIEADGQTRWMHVAAIAVNFDAQTHGWLATFGPQRRYPEIEQLKNEIVAAVSHELKTPIASIKAYAATLRDNPDTTASQRDDFLGVIDQQADRLTRAVDELLLASRVEAEQLPKRRVATSLDAILDAALQALAFDDAAHALERRTAGITLSGDPDLLRDVFYHLIENAAKFSPYGASIAIDATVRDEAVVVNVSDCGIGIAEEHVAYIFERFYRVEHALTAPTGGSGLGLFLVRALVRAHGGSITVASEPTRGSTFTLRFPVREA